MKYKLPLICKYSSLLICIFMFLKHAKILDDKTNILISLVFCWMVIIFDYMFIDNHPNFIYNKYKNEKFVESQISDHIILGNKVPNIQNDITTTNLDDNETTIDDYPSETESSNYQLPTDFKKPSYDLDTDCYRRGDGRGNNKNVQRYYTKEVL